jgi:hypothetical protein
MYHLLYLLVLGCVAAMIIKASLKLAGYVALGFAVFVLVPISIQGFLGMQQDKAKTNAIYGTIRNVDVYADFDAFNLNIPDPIFYLCAESGLYKIQYTFGTSTDFNGTRNKYNLLVNNKPTANTLSVGGSLFGQYKQVFYDIRGNELSTVVLDITIHFYVNKITVEISADMTPSQNALMRMVIEKEGGLVLRIIDQQYSLTDLIGGAQ